MVEKSCPLCKGTIINRIVEGECTSCRIKFSNYQTLNDAISRIKQQAKQEVFDSFPYKSLFNLGILNYAQLTIDFDKLKEWKKRNGVE
jgi:hypothetical protein